MSSRRFHLHGLFVSLLALMIQLGAGAAMPRIDPIAIAGVLCHSNDDTDGAPAKAPGHPADCLVCPFCVALHVQFAALAPVAVTARAPDTEVVQKAGLPPPSTAPPAVHRPPSQPRAPPTFS